MAIEDNNNKNHVENREREGVEWGQTKVENVNDGEREEKKIMSCKFTYSVWIKEAADPYSNILNDFLYFFFLSLSLGFKKAGFAEPAS